MKRLIVCADGTWNVPDRRDREKKRRHRSSPDWIRKPSNVVKMARAILPQAADGTPQVVLYDAGVGTGWGILDPLIGGALGHGLAKNILDCYRFLVHNYAPGDEIYMFGFSRGAFTVRSLAGMIGRCGLLPKDRAYWIPEAYEHYRLPHDAAGQAAVAKHRAINHVHDVTVKLVGVWDTVGSLGIPIERGLLGRWIRRRYAFHNVELGPHVEHAYHALAIDERRKPFKPTLWEAPGSPDQHVEQVWFAGTHSNVGGGFDPDGLANCAFQWMVEKAGLGGKGLAFDMEYVGHYAAHPEGPLRSAVNWFYRLLGQCERQIGASAQGHESVAASAMDRLNASKPPAPEDGGPYKPQNLLAYLKRTGGP